MTLFEFLTERLREDEYAILGDLSRPDPPYRAMADIAAKRAILRRSHLYARDLLLLLASVYSDHPDFNPEWKIAYPESATQQRVDLWPGVRSLDDVVRETLEGED